MSQFVFLIALVFSVNFAFGNISTSVQKKIDGLLPVLWPDKVVNYAPVLSDNLPGTEVYQVTTQSEVLGYFVLTSSFGRYEKFDYLVVYSEELEVLMVQILKYRSGYGGEVAGKKWLKQFEGNKGEKLEYGKDIQAISGATFSGRSITKDIPELTEELSHELKE